VWFNSMQREEPYLGLTCFGNPCESRGLSQGTVAQVVHGCRQLVP
jgi:hypothetical protein